MLKEYLKRLLDPVIALATLSNILAILAITGVIGTAQVDMTTRIGTIAIATLIQLGVMKQPKNTQK
jgi:hypothetical protein